MTSAFRGFRRLSNDGESASNQAAVPFLSDGEAAEDGFVELSDLECGRNSRKSSPQVGIPRPRSASPGYHDSTASTIHATKQNRWRVHRRLASFFGVGRGSRMLEKDLGQGLAYAQAGAKTSRSSSCVLRLLAIALMLLGLFQLVVLVLGIFEAFFPDDLEWVSTPWATDELGHPGKGLDHWPTDSTRGIKPVACHSHNDYWRKEPLYSAIRAGCTGVEADVWLYDNELFVGHTSSSLTPNRTLNNLYITPLLNLLEQQNPMTEFHPALDTPRNGVFDTSPSTSIVLLIDFKTAGDVLWPVVQSQLEPLRVKHYLTYFNGSAITNGPITVVATGNAPFTLLASNANYRDIFFDAPLDQMSKIALDESPSTSSIPLDPESPTNLTSPSAATSLPSSHENKGQGHSGGAPTDPMLYSPANSYYASVSFTESIGYPWRSRLSHSQLNLIRRQIHGAHARGLRVRYWDIPAWPKGLRNYIWRVLVREGVDVLNVDDLKYATQADWGPRKGGWGGKWWT